MENPGITSGGGAFRPLLCPGAPLAFAATMNLSSDELDRPNAESMFGNASESSYSSAYLLLEYA